MLFLKLGCVCASPSFELIVCYDRTIECCAACTRDSIVPRTISTVYKEGKRLQVGEIKDGVEVMLWTE
jgi:hypothetical protein